MNGWILAGQRVGEMYPNAHYFATAILVIAVIVGIIQAFRARNEGFPPVLFGTFWMLATPALIIFSPVIAAIWVWKRFRG